MSNEIDVQLIQKTQKVLGKHIKKPPLTEKLLRKPPFRFLHDIVNSVIRETGFLKGLYSERELVSENVKEKDDKIAFLNKLIDAIRNLTGTQLNVRATKIIAGLEVVETNLLLQAIGSALTNKLDSTAYITQLLNTGKKSKHNSKNVQDEKKKEKHNQVEKTKIPSVKNTKSSDKIKTTTKTLLAKDSTDSVESVRVKKKKVTKEKAVTELANEDQPEIIINKTKKEEIVEESMSNGYSTKPVQEDTKIIELVKEEINVPIATSVRDKIENEKSSNETIHKGPELKSESFNKLDNYQEPIHKSEIVSASTSSTCDSNILPFEMPERTKVRPRSSLRPPSLRPSSARPGAPRLRNDNLIPEGEMVALGKVNVIIENLDNKEVDEEETVTVIVAPEFNPHPTTELPVAASHLVEQILEQIQQHDNNVPEHAKTNVNIEWEQDGFRNRNAMHKELEQLMSAIQMLTKTANPLGKLVNYLHEDIEAMYNELEMWINSGRQIMGEVANHKRLSHEHTKPLRAQLQEIEENIAVHQQQIISAHGNIIRNEQRIRDLLIM